jgi:hypothetical protein
VGHPRIAQNPSSRPAMPPPRRPAAYRRTPGHSTAGQKEKDGQSRPAPPGIPVAKSAPAIGAGAEKALDRRVAIGSPSREKRSEMAGANRHELSQRRRFTTHS